MTDTGEQHVATRLETLEAGMARLQERCEKLERVVEQQQEIITKLTALLPVDGHTAANSDDNTPAEGLAGLPFVSALAHAPVTCSGPIRVCGPVHIPGGETRSSNGVMATVTAAGQLVWTETGAKAIHVLDLWTGVHNEITCLSGAAFVCSRAERIIVGIWKAEQVLEGDVEQLLQSRSLDTFNVHGVPTIGHPACRTDVSDSLGWILYRGSDWKPVRLDLDSFEWTVLDNVGEVTRLSSLLSFQGDGILAVAEKDGHARMLLDDGEELELGELSRPISWCCVFCDMKECTKNVLQTSTMVVDTEGNAVMNGKYFPLGFRPCPSQGIVRLTEDILLFLDSATWHWVAIKLSVQ